MYSWFLIALTVIFAVIVAKLILKKYNAIFVFFASGVVILMTASLLTGTPILPKGSLGNVFLDTFGFLTATFKKNIAGIGTLIMVVTGYATYMKHIGASTKLAFTASRLLGGISNKYLILSAFYLVGMCLKLVLPSQASLAVLMLATVFPVFIALGIRPITAASVLALLCLDYGPNDGSTLFMANVAEMNVVDMFLRYQYKVVLSIVLVTAFLIPPLYGPEGCGPGRCGWRIGEGTGDRGSVGPLFLCVPAAHSAGAGLCRAFSAVHQDRCHHSQFYRLCRDLHL